MGDRPRLLLVSPRFLFPVDSGGKIRTTQVLRGLRGGIFRVTLASPAPRAAHRLFREDLEQVCDRFVYWPERSQGLVSRITRMRHALSALPISVASDRSVGGSRAVRSLLDRGQDVVVFDFPHSLVLAPRHLPCASVLFTHNVEAEIFERHAGVAADPLRRALWVDQHRKMTRFERAALQRCDRVIAVSPRDRTHFEKRYGARRVSCISTGVDLDFLSCSEPGAGPHVIFTGSMDWLANVDAVEFFLEQVWPQVLTAVPGATMTVVGRAPPSALVEKARTLYSNWRFTGYVDDIRPHVRAAAVSVIPLRVGGGTRLKVFEAMALGCPVVSTAIGVEGLPLQDRKHYLLADSAPDFAAAIVDLLRNRERALGLSSEARRYVEANFSYQAVARQFEEICLQAWRDRLELNCPAKIPVAVPAPQADANA